MKISELYNGSHYKIKCDNNENGDPWEGTAIFIRRDEVNGPYGRFICDDGDDGVFEEHEIVETVLKGRFENLVDELLEVCDSERDEVREIVSRLKEFVSEAIEYGEFQNL